MIKYKHIAFDFDGVVADSAGICAEEINRLRQRYPEIPEVTTQEDFAYIYPGPLRTSLRRFGLTEEMVGEFFDHHSARMMCRARELRPFQDVVSILSEVDPADFTIVTSSYSTTVKEVLSTCMTMADIDHISILGRELRMKKSAKFQDIMDRKSIRPRELLKIGDMVSDILYASDASIDCAAVGWGYHPLSYLRAFDAKHYLESPHELEALIQKNLYNGGEYVY